MTARVHKLLRRCCALLATLTISACAGTFPYSIPIQQGNVITVEMIQELKLGMDKRKVRFILGTPLVTDAFHQNRWDYFYSYNPGSGDIVQQRASLYFDQDQLVRIDADIQSDIDFQTVTHATDKVLVVPRKKDDGFLAAITPGFVSRDEEQQQQDEIKRNLDSGFNEPQPGTAEPGAPPPASAAVDPALEPAGGVESALPSEIYAPNSSVGFENAKSAAPVRATETVSAETREQSSYLQSLFEGFGAATATEQTTGEVSGTLAEPSDVSITTPDPTVPTRD